MKTREEMTHGLAAAAIACKALTEQEPTTFNEDGVSKEVTDLYAAAAPQNLNALMRRISRENYAAGWRYDLEVLLWGILQRDLPNTAYVDPVDLEHLRRLASASGGWFSMNKPFAFEAYFVPMDEWQREYALRKKSLF
jgi:hypothetical protein